MLTMSAPAATSAGDAGGGGATLDRGRDRVVDEIEHRRRRPGRQEMLGHGRAHHAQSDVADSGHASAPGVKLIGKLLHPVTLPLWNRTLASWSTE